MTMIMTTIMTTMITTTIMIMNSARGSVWVCGPRSPP